MKQNDNQVLHQAVMARIALDSWEKEQSARRHKRTRALTLTALSVFVLSGSFITANAATGGRLADKVEQTVKTTWQALCSVTDDKGKEIAPVTMTDTNGDTIAVYKGATENGSQEIEVNLSELERNQMKMKATTEATDDRLTTNIEIADQTSSR